MQRRYVSFFFKGRGVVTPILRFVRFPSGSNFYNRTLCFDLAVFLSLIYSTIEKRDP
ncbi:hypothetical protein CpB0466 [Chlamydia pneumoniae TW-183]|uniref:Uncharacterized protein n=1 Tax=Chlamydia pneumoniae TaxID=83558 RepID=A0ABN3YPZ0_CHLPN|nr:hypothetical protein CpB0466 [Chlamydia pneumoniae TW-183]